MGVKIGTTLVKMGPADASTKVSDMPGVSVKIGTTLLKVGPAGASSMEDINIAIVE